MKEKIFYWLTLLFLTFVFFIPAANIQFSWVDDGDNLQTTQKFLTAIEKFDTGQLGNLFVERRNGRFRPAYWMGQTAIYSLGGNNPTLHYSLHFLLIFLILIGVFEVVSLLTGSKIAGLFSASLFLINPINVENWYRLGPQEPFVALFLVYSVYFLLKDQSRWLPVFFLLLALLSKETAMAILPPILILYLGKVVYLKKKNMALERYFLFGLMFSLTITYITFSTRAGYSTNYSYDLGEILQRFLVHLRITVSKLEPFLLIFVVSFLARSIIGFCKKGKKLVNLEFLLEIFFIAWFIFFFLVQSPWVYVMERYMLPAALGVLIFMGIEFHYLTLALRKRGLFVYRSWLIFLSISLFFYLTANTFSNINYGRRSAHGTKHVQQMVKYLADNGQEGETVLVNFKKGESTMELEIETGIHLELFYQRGDLNVDYLDLENLPKRPFLIVSGSAAPLGYPEDIIEEKLKVKSKVILNSEGEFPVVTTSLNLPKQGIKKFLNWVSGRKQFDWEGIYTPYYLKDYWKIYEIN